MNVRDRQRGALFGLAVDDALGAAVEFMPPGSFPPVTDNRDGGPHGLAPGEWTDDTSMALALADSITIAGWDLADQLQRYVAWWREGRYSVNGDCFDSGTTTQVALATFLRDRDPLACGLAGERSSGNGSIMRLAPVPIAFHRWLEEDFGGLSQRAKLP
jgi:ADP-ribosyl-[dinitrogen reductase] hydrolase